MSNKQPISTFLGIAAAVLLATSSYAAIINVPGDLLTIQGGINDAANGDEVVVAQGEYFENINFNGKAITVRSTDPNDPGVVMHTIINSGGIGHVVTCNSGEGSDTVLSGFVITGGNATGAGEDGWGGGMFALFTSPTVTNCSFIGNTGKRGGGLYTGSGNITLTNCTFSGNTAVGIGQGGGMYSDTGSGTVTNCSFIGNTALAGGGMYNLGGNPTVTNCTFSGNIASGVGPFDGGGGLFQNTSGFTSVTNCSFIGNAAISNGGGMHLCSGSTHTVTNCTFSGNSAGLNGGGMHLALTAQATVSNCSFSGNTANSGGGMHNLGNNPTLINTGFCDNTPDAIDGTFTDGGGNSLLYCAPSFPKPDPCPTDTNDDGVTNVLDLIQLLLQFGQACP